MTIKNDLSIEYRIPEDIKKKIPEYFYQAFFWRIGFGVWLSVFSSFI